MVEGNFSPSTKNFSSPSPHQPPRGFQTWSMTPQNRPATLRLHHEPIGPTVLRQFDRLSRCHFAWKWPRPSNGRSNGAWVISNSTVRAAVSSLTSSITAPLAKGMYQ